MFRQKLRIIVSAPALLADFHASLRPCSMAHTHIQFTHQLASCDADSLVGILEHRNGIVSACTWLFHAMNPAVLCAVH